MIGADYIPDTLLTLGNGRPLNRSFLLNDRATTAAVFTKTFNVPSNNLFYIDTLFLNSYTWLTRTVKTDPNPVTLSILRNNGQVYKFNSLHGPLEVGALLEGGKIDFQCASSFTVGFTWYYVFYVICFEVQI